MSLSRGKVLGILSLTIVTMFCLSAFWEFRLERWLCETVGLPYDQAFEAEERWRFILTSTAFAALSLIAPALLLFDAAGKLRRSYTALNSAKSLAQSLTRIDPLTGLPNRAVFAEELQAQLDKARAAGEHCGVLLIDINRFKVANGLYGHATGDAVLRIVAERLANVTPNDATIARVGGDEFAVVIPHMADEMPPLELARRISARIGESIQVANASFDLSVTIGISVSNHDSDPESMLRAADIALDRAKRSGQTNIDVFRRQMRDDIRSRADMERKLRAALAADAFVPYYQPLVYLDDRSLYGFELLARWPEARHRIRPDVFIPVAEEVGLIDELTFRILRKACLDARNWRPDLTIALNISPLQLADSSLPARILAVLTQTGLAPGRLEIEVTESAVMSNLAVARHTLSSLRNAGISIALDDFGTGQSSLAQLRTIQFDKIKIDRSFIRSMRTSSDSRKLVAAILSLAYSLDLKTTAEGVESEQDVEWLAMHGCTLGQGYLFGKPLPASEITSLLASPKPKRRLAIAS
ncbi:EAL domain-containing protein [Methyloligella sp. 2.7D]|uniref:putative bifunctional diguanylate cyclase/phosphodiesterase n=1 Tax=unclassified Methyloligella TaxID=2625955 RepID=UPI00157E0C19|nr:EAL domain-containing protein [Methyloligella sp. GL2]QKP77400.1 EAL domain-containing protein [Methyloligella sp. GL2]